MNEEQLFDTIRPTKAETEKNGALLDPSMVVLDEDYPHVQSLNLPHSLSLEQNVFETRRHQSIEVVHAVQLTQFGNFLLDQTR